MTPVLRYFKNSYRKKNKHRYSVWTGIPPSTNCIILLVFYPSIKHILICLMDGAKKELDLNSYWLGYEGWMSSPPSSASWWIPTVAIRTKTQINTEEMWHLTLCVSHLVSTQCEATPDDKSTEAQRPVQRVSSTSCVWFSSNVRAYSKHSMVFKSSTRLFEFLSGHGTQSTVH